MIIKLNVIIDERGKEFIYTEEVMDWLTFPEGVSINGKIIKSGDRYIVKGFFKTVLSLECVRCLEKITSNIEGGFSAVYLDSKNYQKYISGLKQEEEFKDEYFEEAVNNEINISDLVREYILLEMSDYEMCNPHCLNTENIERYSKEDMDPRWQQLLDIEL